MKRNRARFVTALLMATLMMAALAASADAPMRRFALVAGTNDGGPSLERLKYAESDARSFAAVMQELGGVRPQDLVLVVGPSLERFQSALERIGQMVKSPREMDERRELLIYYSGHSDDDGLILGADRVTWVSLRQDINAIPADVKVAIVDSCSSGSMTRAKGGVARPAFLFDASSDMTGHAFLTSASAEEAAQESDRIGGSFFTHYLISGLRGAADAAGDGMVTINEAYTYAYKETLASTERTEYGPQHPSYDFNLTGSGDLVLTDLRSSAAGLTVAEDVAGRLYIRDSMGDLAVELNKTGGQTVELGLEPGIYAVVLDNKGARLGGEVRVTAKQRGYLAMANLKPVSVETTKARGDDPFPEAAKVRPSVASPLDPASAIGAAIGAVVGGSLGKAVGSAVGAAVTAVASAASAAAAAAEAAPQRQDQSQDRPLDQPQPAAKAKPVPQAKAQDSPGVEPLHISFFPDVGEGLFSSTAERVVSINLLAGTSGSIRGFEVGGLANFESMGVIGFQAAGLANIVAGPLAGFQAAGLANYVGGEARFVQSAGLVNVSGGLAGAQFAGLANVSTGPSRGAQVAGLFNWSTGDARGGQLAGIANIAAAGFSGVQVAGVVNWGRSVSGPQISVVNIADTISGAQIGVVNIARQVTGTQIGVLNISQQIDGLPLGLLSIEGRGRYAVDLWVELDGTTTGAFSLGTKRFYSVFSAGFAPGTDPVRWTAGLGLGSSSDLGSMFVDYDLVMVTEHRGFDAMTSGAGWGVGSLYPRARLVLGLPLFGGVAVDVGVVLRVYIPYLSSSLVADLTGPSYVPSLVLGVHL
jgi:uncharacterized protein YcfJ